MVRRRPPLVVALHLHGARGDRQQGADHERPRTTRPAYPAYPDTTGPNYLTYYTDALDANGVAYDIYDVDKRGNHSPDWLGVLSHYDAVIWYMGDDYLTRQPGQGPGTGTARLAVEEMIDVRHFLNEGGKLFYTGKSAGQQYAEGNEFRNFGFPEPAGGRRVLQQRAEPEFDEDDPANADGCIAAQRRLPPVLPGGLHLRRARQHVRRRDQPPVPAARHGPVRGPERGSSTRRAPTTRTTRRRS